MPRDAVASTCHEVALPAGRRGKILPADNAGEFAVHCHSTWVDQLAATGWLDEAERDAAAMLHQAFEHSRLRPRLAARCDGVVVDHDAAGDTPFEQMNPAEMASWRRLHRLLREVPAVHRHQVQCVCCWNQPPWDVRSLRLGLKVLADALRRAQRRR
jgi:hypothetical protein